MLRRHYGVDDRPWLGLFADEIESPCKTRRADAIWCPLTVAAGTRLVGHEIKVSRSDLRSEIADPSKADPWSQYCNHWYIVVGDPAIVADMMDEIPEAWGVMAPPSGRLRRSMTILREAPVLTPRNPSLAYRRLLAWQFANLGNKLASAERGIDRRDRQIADLRDQVARLRDGIISPQEQRDIEEIKKLLNAINDGTRGKIDGFWIRQHMGDIVATVIDLAGTKAAISSLRYELGQIVRDLSDENASFVRARRILAETASDLLAKLPEEGS